MEEEIKKWKNMWKEQKSKSINVEKLIKRLNQLEKKAKMKRVGLSLLLMILIVATVIFASELLSNKFSLISYVLLFIAIIVKLIPLYKTKFNLITSVSDFNNHNFIIKLKENLDFNHRHVVLYLFIATLALNSALIDLYAKGTIFNIPITDENRIYFHLSTIVLFIIGYIMCKRSMEHTKREVLNLIMELKNSD